MTISGFQIIAANAVANWDAIVFYGGAKTGDTLSNLTIDCTNATGTGSICGINGNSSTGPFNTFAMTNVTITMGAGAYKNAPFIFTGPSGTHGTPWTLTNVNTTGGTYSKIQYQDNITITGGSFESNTASGAGALDIVSSAGVLTVNGTAFDGGYGIVLNTCGSLTAGSTIENCTGANMIGNGILLNTASNVAVTGNNLQGVAGDNVSYAFQPATSCSFTNNILNGGAGEFYTYNSTSCTLTNNTAKNTTAHAFEIAGSSTGTIEEYNLAINCGLKTALAPGFGFYCHNTSSGTVIAYNIAANMVEGGCGFLDTSSGSCYNNIFYQCGGAWHTGYTQWDGTVIAANGGYLDSNEAGLYDSSSGVWTIKNNISVGNWPYEINCGSTNPVFNYNLYSPISANAFAYNFQVGGLYTWAAWKAAAFTPDVSSPTPANPNWISHPANGATSLSATDFQLAANSRAINIGTNLSLTPDYAGTTVPQGGVPDMGAYESTWCRWGANGVFGLTIWGVAGY
jgi:parallel beta-helix repeat protein